MRLLTNFILGTAVIIGAIILAATYANPRTQSSAPQKTPLATATVQRQEVPGRPSRLVIPKLNVNASLEALGLDETQSMQAPVKWENAGWFELGARPGTIGNAVIAGHLDDDEGNPAVFFKLHTLVEDDVVTVIDENDIAWDFTVDRIEYIDADENSLEKIFGEATSSYLNLITCAGSWDQANQTYDTRLVVYTKAMR